LTNGINSDTIIQVGAGSTDNIIRQMERNPANIRSLTCVKYVIIILGNQGQREVITFTKLRGKATLE
jgi:hypothetical protein